MLAVINISVAGVIAGSKFIPNFLGAFMTRAQ